MPRGVKPAPQARGKESLLTILLREARLAALVALLSLAAPAAWTLAASPARAQEKGAVRVIEVKLDDYSIAMPGTLSAGPTMLKVINVGQADHNVEFEGGGIERKLPRDIAPGESDTLLIDFRPGSYYVYCPVGHHENYGMHMELTVTGGGAGPTAEAVEAPQTAEHPEAAELPKLLRWLGRFHPPSVNFPIALIVAAALAETLRRRTKNPSFDTSMRFCLWLGVMGAVGGGMLGWFFAGFSLTDDSWLMTVHRWMGTATVAVALITLVVNEADRGSPGSGPPPWRTLLLFLAAVMVLVTGFFGGAMVYGLDHYAWPGG